MAAVDRARVAFEPLAHQVVAAGVPSVIQMSCAIVKRWLAHVVWLTVRPSSSRNVLHQRAAAGDVQHLDAAADGEQRQVGVDRASRQLELVVVAAGFGRAGTWDAPPRHRSTAARRRRRAAARRRPGRIDVGGPVAWRGRGRGPRRRRGGWPPRSRAACCTGRWR